MIHDRSKHIDVRCHFLKNLSRVGVIELTHGPTQEQLADMTTNPVKLETLSYLKKKMGMMMQFKVS